MKSTIHEFQKRNVLQLNKTNLQLLITILLFSSTVFSQAGSVCWREVSAGQNFTLAIKSDGTMWGWGNNGNLLGLNGNTANQNIPVQIGIANDWMTVSAGGNHSLAVKTNGTLWAWGSGMMGQLGNGLFNSATWTVTQLGTATDWIKVAAGSEFSLAIKNTGTLWSWGLNNTGQLGIGNTTNQNVPVQVGSATNWADIEAGNQHSLALDTAGFVYAWGNNTFGQLGNGTNTTSLTPIVITSSPGWIDISAGFDHSLFLDSGQGMFSCGNNNNGQLADGTNTASNVLIPTSNTGAVLRYIAVSAGQTHTMAIRDDFTLWTSGFNNQGQLGLGNFVNVNTLNQVGTSTNWSAISAGFVHSAALESTTDLWTAGRGLEGQLGVGSFTNSNVIVQVICPTTPLGTNEMSTANMETRVYPNPTHNSVSLDYTSQNAEKTTITLTTILGQIINRRTVTSTGGLQTETIDLSNQANGLYFVTVTTENATYTSKVMKQ
jgi:alpha-tubulin suppressor-like RCC1 family protein